MVSIYRCELELNDSLYYATREIGRLYETEPVIHNYALCYALGLVDSEVYSTTVAEEHSYRYFCPEQVPKYEEHLTPLNKQGIYVTPARAVSHTAILNTWKYANNNYHVEMEKTHKNIPSFGRAKEIAPESIFEFFVICQKELKLPKWIRLGKWMSKAEVKVEQLPQPQTTEGLFTCKYPLNPLDVMFTNQVISYDVVNMPPVSLIQNVQMRGQYYQFTEMKDIKLPVRMAYHFHS
ncbi:type I-D CRISPR-associated protein Cas5/Csc1 [Nostoc sp. FACHB-152]|uniref:type I-D CRISPR-associated protein Cas5/Csc1 n=1 Tax=unclassified Nostoc TaxID=2593658 RepID=UPI001684097F|nr:MULTISPECIES: type I-D CRISPR-associated protein Cas5/Csc1 [unclassified Nostoc]MBD2449867.1 type I-D CRISPR-associated protein Cas5/Csc1 [Nostoc sp. FACHB-152]MBD2471843.1 type I-D CRISPR-associated protein Cas5/Csc1 [Nostoc sp. FACHB-145]